MVFEKLKKKLDEKSKEREELKAYEREMKKKYEQKRKEAAKQAKKKELEKKYKMLAERAKKPKSQRLKESYEKAKPKLKSTWDYLGRVGDNIDREVQNDFNFSTTSKKFKKKKPLNRYMYRR